MSKQLESLAHKLVTTERFLTDSILENPGFWKYLKETTKSPTSDMAWIQTEKGYTFQITKGDKYWKNGKDFVSVQYGLRHSGNGSDHLVNTAEVPETIDIMELAKELPYRCHCNCDCNRDDIEGIAVFQEKMLDLFWSSIHSIYSKFLDIELAKEN